MKYFIFNNKKVAYKNIIQKKKKVLKEILRGFLTICKLTPI